MRSVSKEVIKKNVSFSLPEVAYDQAVLAAQSTGQSLAAYLRFAVMAYIRKWKNPTGDVAGAGLFCNHPSCLRSAAACKRPEDHKSQDMWGPA